MTQGPEDTSPYGAAPPPPPNPYGQPDPNGVPPAAPPPPPPSPYGQGQPLFEQPQQPQQSQEQPQPYTQPPYAQPPYAQPYQQGYAPYGAAPTAYGVSPQTPWGVHPVTGIPYSDKSKVVAGLLQILLPLGIGRFYIGDTGIGVAQLIVTLVTCGIGGLWPVIDGIVMLATDSKDSRGMMLRS